MHELALTPPSFCSCAFPSRPCPSLQILAGWQRGRRGPALPTGRSHGTSPPAAAGGGRWRGGEGWRTGGLSLLFSLPPSPTGTSLPGLWGSQRTEVPSAGSGCHLTHQSTEVLVYGFKQSYSFYLTPETADDVDTLWLFAHGCLSVVTPDHGEHRLAPKRPWKEPIQWPTNSRRSFSTWRRRSSSLKNCLKKRGTTRWKKLSEDSWWVLPHMDDVSQIWKLRFLIPSSGPSPLLVSL